MKTGYLPLLVVALAVSGCMHQAPEPPLTQLEKREIQSRDFEVKDSKLVMKAMMNVLQDEGFIIKNAVLDLGLLSGEKNIDIETKWDKFFGALSNAQGNYNARWNKISILEASANISEFGELTRVRMNFQVKTLDNFGCPSKICTVLDPCTYEDFFSKVSKALFLEEESL